jgi:hypothetical protein
VNYTQICGKYEMNYYNTLWVTLAVTKTDESRQNKALRHLVGPKSFTEKKIKSIFNYCISITVISKLYHFYILNEYEYVTGFILIYQIPRHKRC